jgi:hypothetical protein
LGLLEVWTEAGGVLADRFLVGSFKGFFTLLGENYVSEERFREILRTELRALGKRKLPLVIITKVKRSCRELVEAVRGR